MPRGLIAILVITGVIVLLALVGVDFRPPPAWLLEWTDWAGEVVAVIVAAKVFWEGASLLKRYAQSFKANSIDRSS